MGGGRVKCTQTKEKGGVAVIAVISGEYNKTEIKIKIKREVGKFTV